MWGIILTGGKAALTAVSSLMNAAIRWAAIGLAYRSGKKRAQLDAAQAAGAIQDAQLEIASKPDAHRTTLLDRMWKRKRS